MQRIFIFALLAGFALASTFQVTMNTSPLIGNAAGPYSVDFQLTDGSGLGAGNTTIVLSQFDFGGGSAASPVLSGSATGNFTSGLHLDSMQFFNEAKASFTPGTSLQFLLSISTAGFSSPFPDEFSFAVLDGIGAEIVTDHPFHVLLLLDLTDANAVVEAYGSQPYGIGAPALRGVPTGAGVPEPATGALVLLGGVVWMFRRR